MIYSSIMSAVPRLLSNRDAEDYVREATKRLRETRRYSRQKDTASEVQAVSYNTALGWARMSGFPRVKRLITRSGFLRWWQAQEKANGPVPMKEKPNVRPQIPPASDRTDKDQNLRPSENSQGSDNYKSHEAPSMPCSSEAWPLRALALREAIASLC